MALEKRGIVIVGSGFAGSLLARILASRGRDVLLVERGQHPRFALGESSTPLANLTLERLARRFDLPDLRNLATWGRWKRAHPELPVGLKRGFTFYGHRAAEPFEAGSDNARRLLVAASPEDDLADTQWSRRELDHFLVRQAVAAGVDYRDHTELTDIESMGEGLRLRGRGPQGACELAADFLVDASGPRGFLASRGVVEPSSQPSSGPAKDLLFGHLDSLRPFESVASCCDDGPYPDCWSAVHHLLDEGWMYQLRFDDGRTSVGWVLRSGVLSDEEPPGDLWRRLSARYPSLERQFAGASPVSPLAVVRGLRHRLAGAVGEGWALLPHSFAFFDPLFATGIAWSLLGVERLADVLLGTAGDLTRYGRLLDREADHLESLIAGAWRVMGDFSAFAAYSQLYFAAASFGEVERRLDPDHEWAWKGFLGSDDEIVTAALEAASKVPSEDLAGWVSKAIAPRNIAGLADPRRRNLYPVDFAPLIANSHLLGRTAEEMKAAIPRLLGADVTVR
ncbi:MAG: FAD-dependent oxidoreductase [Acidobacteriota bacterium]